MAYRELSGNLFNSKATTLVNTVNCVGAMGKGIALEFRRRFPDMFQQYQEDCKANKLKPGRIYAYQEKEILILNFAIKNDWKHPSKVEWIESTLKQFVAGYQKRNIRSIAFPWMGAMNGGIPIEVIQGIMRKYLQPLPDIDIEVYHFDPNISDPLFDRLKLITNAPDPSRYFSQSNLQKRAYELITNAVIEHKLNSFSQLIKLNLVGKTTIDKLYVFLLNEQQIDSNNPKGEGPTQQLPLF